MKKTLILAALSAVTAFSFAAEKTVTFDFTDPTKYGYEKPEKNAGTPIAYEGTIVSDGVTITNAFSGSTATTFRFFTANTDEANVTLRLGKDGVFTVNAGGATISKIAMTGSNLTANNLSITPGTFDNYTWTGSAETVTFSRLNTTLQFATMAVTFEASEGGETGETGTVTESFVAIDATGIQDCFANASSDGAKSIVSFNTNMMDVEAVGGRTPVDIAVETAETPFTDWVEWNEPTWSNKSQNLNDMKRGVDTIFFYYVLGSGNPAVEIGHELSSGNNGYSYRPTYTYYESDGSKGMPVSGLYYKFTPKADGQVKVQIWSNKNNRKTFVVKESTQKPIAYTKEGYVNGGNYSRTIDNVVMKDINGADSIGSMTEKILYNNAQLDSIHIDVLWKFTCTHNKDGEDFTCSEKNATQIKNYTDSLAALNIAYKLDTIKSQGVDDQYIIAGGNQHFWGWITFDVEAGESYWMFQHSSQIGFGGYEFTYEADPAGIEEIASAVKAESKGTFDLFGRPVKTMQAGKAYIVGGKTVFIRE